MAEHGGRLRVWAADPVDDKVERFYRERFNPTLKPLLELDFDRVLVTHGRAGDEGRQEGAPLGAALEALVPPRLRPGIAAVRCPP